MVLASFPLKSLGLDPEIIRMLKVAKAHMGFTFAKSSMKTEYCV